MGLSSSLTNIKSFILDFRRSNLCVGNLSIESDDTTLVFNLWETEKATKQTLILPHLYFSVQITLHDGRTSIVQM